MLVYAKAIMAVLGAGVIATQVSLDDGQFSKGDALTVLLAVVTAINVALVTNEKKLPL